MSLVMPELALLAGALGAFALSVLRAPLSRVRAWSILATLASLIAGLTSLEAVGHPLGPYYAVDTFSQLAKSGIAFGLLLVLVMIRDLSSARPHTRRETPFFLLLSTIGMMMMVSATELLTLYVALELAAYGLYVLAALHRDQTLGSEAGAKYIIFGAVSSAITLYGMSLLTAATGSTDLRSVATAALGGSPIVLAGIALALAGFFFKLAATPFHFWAPDVYTGAPHEIVAFIATASKLAAIAAIARIAALAVSAGESMQTLFIVLGVVSMTLGNLAALAQRDLKRLLAYSAVAHAGYLFLGYGALSSAGIAATLFYGVSYLAFSALAFVVVCALGVDGTNPTRESLHGLHARSPWLAALLLIALFGLAGIPPTAGFSGKWFLFAAAMERGLYALVLIAAINSTIALYYYLQLVKAAYLAEPRSSDPVLRPAPALFIAGALAAVVTLVFGVYPAPLWVLAQRATALLIPG
jgi:NADH-quinone oxidoreductase subunit N